MAAWLPGATQSTLHWLFHTLISQCHLCRQNSMSMSISMWICGKHSTWILNDSFPKCGLVTFIRPKLGKKAISPLFILLQHHIYRTGGPPIGELVNMDEAAARCLSRCSIADFLAVFDILNLSWKSEKCHLISPDMVTWTVLTMLTFPYQDWSDLPNR